MKDMFLILVLCSIVGSIIGCCLAQFIIWLSNRSKLPFKTAKGKYLNNIGELYDIKRKEFETDKSYRKRITNLYLGL